MTSFTDNEGDHIKSIGGVHRPQQTSLIGKQLEENKVNINGKYKTSKESLTKLDLSKIMTCKDSNVPSTYSGPRSISNSNNYEMINYGN